jgi:hypothetical protein
MDTAPPREDRGVDAGAQPAWPEEAVMWWIIGFVAVCTIISVVISRRGSTGASRADDLPSSHQPGMGHGPVSGTGGYGGGGDGGGGF